MSSPAEFVGGARILMVHAHPDDETVQTGALVASLAQDAEVFVVTCTRGEQGEIVPGVLPTDTAPNELVTAREAELSRACAALGVAEQYFLGTAPARVPGSDRRDYRDSGMRWVSEGVAGPADNDDPDTFTASPLEDEVEDLLALIREVSPNVIVGYDREGSYGHPDHIRAHHLAVAASERSGLPLFEVASEDSAAGFTWFSLPQYRDQVIAALRCHATQLSVRDGEIVHVGGQHQQLPLTAGLRRTR
jgi:N-acetyl-1-D-myo-inositol-2-amino-2-deoxy-alpha-D-glucopyranoside deacetylase